MEEKRVQKFCKSCNVVEVFGRSVVCEKCKKEKKKEYDQKLRKKKKKCKKCLEELDETSKCKKCSLLKKNTTLKCVDCDLLLIRDKKYIKGKRCSLKRSENTKKKNRTKKNFTFDFAPESNTFVLEQEAINDVFQEYTTYDPVILDRIAHENLTDIFAFLDSSKTQKITEMFINFSAQVILSAQGEQINNYGTVFSTGDKHLKYGSRQNIKALLKKHVDEILNTTLVSGLVVSGLASFTIHVAGIRFVSMQVGGGYVPLPKVFAKKFRSDTILNIKNKNNKCFLYCYAAFLIYKKDKIKCINSLNDKIDYSNPLIYDIENLNLNLLEKNFPLSVEDIIELEDVNLELKVRVFELIVDEANNVLINKIFESSKSNGNFMNLLLYENHYCLIQKLNALKSMSTKYKYVCKHCCFALSRYQSYMNHEQNCRRRNKSQKYKLPLKKEIEFDFYKSKIKMPFYGVADCETFFNEVLPEFDKKNSDSMHLDKKHDLMSIGYKIQTEICPLNEEFKNVRLFTISKTESFTNNFISKLIEDIQKIDCYFDHIKEFPVQPKLETVKNTIDECFFCSSPMENAIPAFDLFTGMYLGESHGVCLKKCNNLDVGSKLREIPIYFHNFGGYDSHLILGIIGKSFKIGPIIAKSCEKITSLMLSIPNCKTSIKIIDSLSLMNSSLASLSSKITNWKFIPEDLKDLRYKQHFPYAYFTQSHDQDIFTLLEKTELPSDLCWWDNILNPKICGTPEEILRGKKELELMITEATESFNLHKCKNMRDFVHLYLKVDVLLLNEILESFRNTNFKTWEIDPLYFVSLPGYAWNAMLKYTSVKMDLLHDFELIDFFQSNAIRGGVSTVCEKKRLQANNKYMQEFYDKSKPTKYILYLDITNLYGKAMTFDLPLKNFEWITNEEEIKWVLNTYLNGNKNVFESTGEIGYIFELDLEYPEELHDLHKGFPMAPTHKDNKLIPDLCKKEYYKIHLITLRLYLKHGLIVSKIHRVLKFFQSPWLKKYIDKNTEIRKKSEIATEKDNAKLMNNAVYGKTMENKMGRQKTKLKSSLQVGQIENIIESSDFKSFKIINSDLVQLNSHVDSAVFDSPVYVGFSILELSKAWFYHQIYDIVIPNFKDVKLSYIDTDSVIIETSCDPYQVMRSNKCVQQYFDLSVYPDAFLVTSEFTKELKNNNKGVLGTFKDEYVKTFEYTNEFGVKSEIQNVIVDFVALRAKSYSVQTLKDKFDTLKNINYHDNTKKNKGLKNCILNKKTHLDFVNILETNNMITESQVGFQSWGHQIHTVTKKLKNIISSQDNKRENNPSLEFHTLPFGYVHFNNREKKEYFNVLEDIKVEIPKNTSLKPRPKRSKEDEEAFKKKIQDYEDEIKKLTNKIN